MPLTPEEIQKRINCHKPTPHAIENHERVRSHIEQTMAALDLLVPEGREHALMLTKLEEAMFWANAGIARNHDKL